MRGGCDSQHKNCKHETGNIDENNSRDPDKREQGSGQRGRNELGQSFTEFHQSAGPDQMLAGNSYGSQRGISRPLKRSTDGFDSGNDVNLPQFGMAQR